VAAILLIGTLDTKGREVAFVRDLIAESGRQVIVMDAGVYPSDMAADIGAREVAAAGGGDLAELRRRRDRGHAMAVMQRGVEALTAALQRQGRIAGVLGLGGSGGTALATAAMRTLPVGLPKLMVSTLASGDVAPYVGVKDVTMMHSVVDIAGLNRLSERILANAAGMIVGAVERARPPREADRRPLVAATMFGVTTPCVTALQQRLDREGYDVVIFHATGSGGRAMEGLVRDGFFAAVADVTTTELCDELFGGVLSAGPERLEAAGAAAVPQVVSVGALDMVNFWGPESVPERFRERILYHHNANVTLIRTTPEENRQLGRKLAEKLNGALGQTVLLLPLRGVSMIDAPGQPFHWPEANASLFSALREHVSDRVGVVEIDAHINDDAFVDAYAGELLRLLKG
jgi:uncharacterized protein (UPF0261 family)